MSGPSSTQTQTHGPTTDQEGYFGGPAIQQALSSLGAFTAAAIDPVKQLASLPQQISDNEAKIKRLEEIRAVNTNRGDDISLGDQIAALKQQNIQLQASRPLLERQATDLQRTREFNTKLQDYADRILGGDLGVSDKEKALITQGIAGISQDVATTRGLNRTDVPVMQAIAPAISQAYLGQANANRSLFTGIGQFQQGMDLSQRQLQAGLAGQNPAANLTGVYSGLRSSNLSSQQGYGAMDYLNATANLAQGLGTAYAAGTGQFGKK